MKKNNPILNLKLNIADTKVRVTITPGAHHKDLEYISDFHYHTDHEIHFVKSGKFKITIGSREYVCRKNTLFILPPNTYHITRALEAGDEICFQCHIDKSAKWNLNFDSTERMVDYSMPEADIFLDILREYIVNPTDNNCLRLKSILTIVLLNINDRIAKSNPNMESGKQVAPSVIDNVLGYINKHYFENNVLLGDVAKTVFLSDRQLARIIKAETGETFLRLLTKYRISAAKKLIDETEQTLENISGAVGFSTYCGFWKAFCSCEAITPSEYKQQLMK